MSTLVLVRHGQARPFQPNSDSLSKTGIEQARQLGEYWRAHGVTFDEVYSGALMRHRQTAEAAGFSNYEALPDFNEYNAEAILRAHPDWAPPTDNRHLQEMFDVALPQWISAKLDAAGLETWTNFHERVVRGFRQIVDADRPSRRVVVFTSAGPIGVILQTVLCAPERTAIELHWRIRNCSLTELVFTRDRVSLDRFNTTPHLREVTFR
ncbi:MAG TPA: histidine phosphatase family protein [Bryobacteraceae bacterium]|nr:histidine phosphatase family protein [Bryobacteraceae bacterium]